MPLAGLARRADPLAERVYGRDTLLALAERGVAEGWKHFFVGGAEGVAALLAERLQARFPGMLVAGTHSSPFRPLSSAEDAALEAGSPMRHAALPDTSDAGKAVR